MCVYYRSPFCTYVNVVDSAIVLQAFLHGHKLLASLLSHWFVETICIPGSLCCASLPVQILVVYSAAKALLSSRSWTPEAPAVFGKYLCTPEGDHLASS